VQISKLEIHKVCLRFEIFPLEPNLSTSSAADFIRLSMKKSKKTLAFLKIMCYDMRAIEIA
jgi:hypothetical protein